MSTTPITHAIPTAVLGFPRIGRQRELKSALEGFWKGTLSETELLSTARSLRERHWIQQQAAGITIIPSNDFSLYDQVLDALVLVGATPTRFGTGDVTLQRYFAMARNSSEQTAMEMTKWFDTNYHYLVPEWSADLSFQVDTRKLLGEIDEARRLGIATRPVLIGPVTLLRLGKSVDGSDPMALLPKLLEAYRTVVKKLSDAGVEWVQMDEPSLVTDLPASSLDAYRKAYAELAKAPVKLMLTTYFGALEENLPLAVSLGTAGLHIDAVRAPQQIDTVAAALGPNQVLSLGCVDGRNIWRSNLAELSSVIDKLQKTLGPARLQLAMSCSLLHSPYDTVDERTLDPRIKSWLAFSQQKLEELTALSLGSEAAAVAFAENELRVADRAVAESSTDPAVRAAVASLEQEHFKRKSTYIDRAKVQRSKLKLPLLPTTTIGSFPQTAEVRQRRAAHRKGLLDNVAYEQFLQQQTEDCIRRQEAIGLDVLVHGEFERNDMVKYFGEQLSGYAFTQHGWVQSYGSRCVAPPIIWGDVSRPAPMTVRWSAYAQSLTDRPMKGMLTGPVTMLQWSFVRDDIPRPDVCRQIALAIRDEVADLEVAGIAVIQVDEPAFREGLPLRHADWAGYLDWAVACFRLATCCVRDDTSIHTHMCYSEFNDIMPAIADMDADAISIETTRSRMELLDAFGQGGYPAEIGPGVWDIHSPRVPDTQEMVALLGLARQRLADWQIWVNPDCGLKTRRWEEVRPALKNLVDAAWEVRRLADAGS